MSTYQVTEADQPVAAVSTLATNVVDVINGYETMVEKADGDLKPMVEDLLDMHRRHASDLMEIYNDMGGNPDRAGSLMGAVHTAVANTRDAIGTLDASAREKIISGEERILDSYNDAVAETKSFEAAHRLISDQREALRRKIDSLRD